MTRSFLRWPLACMLGLSLGAAQAQMFTDPAFDTPFRAARWADIDALARARLSACADDTQAVLALGLAASREGVAPARRKEAMARAEACIERQPQAADCQLALGATLAVHAMNEGLLALAGSVGRVRGALTEAHTLQPHWYAARSALASFHVLAPGLMGGSRDRAVELARGAPTPEQVQALQAMLTLADEKPGPALQALMAVRPGSDSGLDADLREWSHQAAFALLNIGQPAPARAWFERARRERPQEARAAYGLARALAEGGAHAEAIEGYERARTLDGAAQLPIDYRAGLSHQALGQHTTARQLLERFVQSGRGPKKSLDDARRRLEQRPPA